LLDGVYINYVTKNNLAFDFCQCNFVTVSGQKKGEGANIL